MSKSETRVRVAADVIVRNLEKIISAGLAEEFVDYCQKSGIVVAISMDHVELLKRFLAVKNIAPDFKTLATGSHGCDPDS